MGYKKELGYWFFMVASCSFISKYRADAGLNITVVVILPNSMNFAWALPKVVPAISMAHESLEKYGLLKGHTINLLNFSTEDQEGGCAENRAQIIAVDTKLYNKPDAFFGPGCVYSVALVGRFASHWKLPLITAGGLAYGFDNGDEFKTIVRMGPTTTKIGEFATSLHVHFNWTTRACLIFYDIKRDDRPHYFQSEGIYLNLREELNMTVEAFPYQEPGNFDYKEIVKFMREKARSKSLHGFPNDQIAHHLICSCVMCVIATLLVKTCILKKTKHPCFILIFSIY